jgi:hypothetical protein
VLLCLALVFSGAEIALLEAGMKKEKESSEEVARRQRVQDEINLEIEQEKFSDFLDDALALDHLREGKLLAKTDADLLIAGIVSFVEELQRRQEEAKILANPPKEGN